MSASLVGSEMCIRDSPPRPPPSPRSLRLPVEKPCETHRAATLPAGRSGRHFERASGPPSGQTLARRGTGQ
eukprot:9954349-Alexandrium_andersonii.AAC.1